MKFKKYECVDVETGEVFLFFVGEKADIKTLFKAFRRTYRKGNTNFWPGAKPKFSPEKSVYALCITSDGGVSVLDSDTMLALMLDCVVKEV